MTLLFKIFYVLVCLFFCFVHILFGQENFQNLNGTWKVSLSNYLTEKQVVGFDADNRFYQNFEMPVPMDINRYFEKEGKVGDLNFGINTSKASWIAKENWLYSRKFNAPEAARAAHAWLNFGKLDYRAIICLNDEIIGIHENAHYPCRIDVSGKLKEKGNVLKVSIESGFFKASKSDWDHGLETKRHLTYKFPLLRKANYQFGWDWCPEMVNVGITGDVNLEWTNDVTFEQTAVLHELNDDLTEAKVTIRAIINGDPGGYKLLAKNKETGKEYEKAFHFDGNAKANELEFTIKKPELWWPIGEGEQHLYHFDLFLLKNDDVFDTKTVRTGFRKVEIDQSPHPVEGRYFTFKINNRPVYGKGANWVPPDLINTGIPKERYKALIDLAVEANINMLRIWGGAVYADPYFLELCDEKGIMVWHDFMFACQTFPGHLASFSDNVKREIKWIVREYAKYPSIVLWCGNNEVQYLYEITGANQKYADFHIYHKIIPEILNVENPTLPYWPGSPFSYSVTDHPNDFTSGDQHTWWMRNVDFWKYRDYETPRFASEFGFMGASTPATLHQFLPDDEEYFHSMSWQHHDNNINTGRLSGLTYKMFEFWTGMDYRDLSIDDYAVLSMLLQGEALTEYILTFRKEKFDNAGQLFWMYNDAYPETHGWTIVDYYLRKKLAFYPVKRMFGDVLVTVAREGDKINFYGVNDQTHEWKGILRYGAFQFDGALRENKTRKVTIPAGSAVILHSVDAKDYDLSEDAEEAVFARLENKEGQVLFQHRLLTSRFKDIDFNIPKINITREGDNIVFSADEYVWGVLLDINGEQDLPDNNFDLIPGVPYKIKWPENKPIPVVLSTGNELFVNN